MSFFIYKITNILNNKIYIGKSKSPDKRFARHLYVAEKQIKNNNQFQPIHAAIAKYGRDNFTLEIIDEALEEIDIFGKEIYWIDFHKSNISRYPDALGYNLTDGGEGTSGCKPSKETKQKISIANSGSGNGMFENTHSDSTKNKMRISQKNRAKRSLLTEDHKQRNSEAAKKQDFSFRIPIETKQNIVIDYATGNYTKKQLAEKYNLKYNSIVKIIRTNKSTYW
jgi:group I intron endonuclease